MTTTEGGSVLKAIKTRAAWMAIGIVLGGSALSYAGVAATSSHGPADKPAASKSAEPKESESPEPSDTHAADANEQHPLNHGFYVSQAAQCKNVDDAVNDVHFTAPADCATNGQAHGSYVSEVARSKAGKGAHGHGNTKTH
jgi:hypothetical protein